MSIARVENYHGYPALVVDGNPIPPMTITTNTTDPDYVRGLFDAGVKVFFEECATAWLSPASVEKLRERIEAIVAINPDALIILRLSLHPPMSWIRRNPDQLVTFSDGTQVVAQPHGFLWPEYDRDVPNVYSLHSHTWRRDAGAALEEFIATIAAMPFADRVIGYFLAAGGTSEWYSMAGTVDRKKGIVSDYSEAFRREFGRLLREKYGSLEKLRAAWRDPDARFDDPGIPGFARRKAAWIDEDMLRTVGDSWASAEEGNRDVIGSFLNPDTAQQVADFYEAWHVGTADSIIHFADIIKRKTDNERVVGAFYGSYGCTRFFENGTVSGVLRILNSGVVDFLAAPGLYENRLPRGYTAQREMQDSFLLRNRMFVAEEDTRTYRASQLNKDFTGTHTLQDTLTVMKRDFGRHLCEETQGWWYDMAPQGGWYDDPDILALIKRQQELTRFSYASDRTKGNEIALIYDEESTRYVSNLTSADLCHWFRCMEVHRIGAPVDYYFHNDLSLDRMPDYKLYIFVNVFYLSDAERAEIERKVKRNGQTALWLYASGVINPDRERRFSPDNISRLVGMNMEMLDGPWSAKFIVPDRNHELLSCVEPDKIYGFFDRAVLSRLWSDSYPAVTRLYPVFYPEEAEATVLGRFQSNGKPALTVRRFAEWTSVFCGAKIVRSDLVRSIAHYSGCHIYNYTDECLYANKRFVVIHAKDTGRKKLFFPRACDPYEVYEGRSYGRGTREIEVAMRAGETLTFHLDGAC